eukprot:TRINITY_DN28779_c0_g1_i1.p1 TRINITY_DN28779_c0_g1~~TRINITY_DN28779_c0_g1_i1.p1  ORF type:complete len:1243 (+),score=292.48 TRINITY_DN28779_c0_g1_i1:68-3730(+)
MAEALTNDELSEDGSSDDREVKHVHVNGLDVTLIGGSDPMESIRRTLGGRYRYEWYLHLRDAEHKLVSPYELQERGHYNCEVASLEEKIQLAVSEGGRDAEKLRQIRQQLEGWIQGERDTRSRLPVDYAWARHCRDYAARRLRAEATRIISRQHNESVAEEDEGRCTSGRDAADAASSSWRYSAILLAGLCFCMLVLVALTARFDFLDRNDGYHPQGAALRNRHYGHYNGSYHNPRCLRPLDVTPSPTASPGTLAPTASPTNTTTNAPTLAPTSPTRSPTGAPSTAATPTGSPSTAPVTQPPTASPTPSPRTVPSCIFAVPYPSAFAVAAAACASLSVASLLYKRLLEASQGDERMEKIADDKRHFALHSLMRMGSWALRFGLLFMLFLWFAIDGALGDRSWRPDVALSLIGGIIATLTCAFVTQFLVGHAAGRAAASCWVAGSDRGAGRAQHTLWRAASCAGLCVSAVSSLAPCVVYGLFANTQAFAGYALGCSFAALMVRVAGGICSSSAALASEACLRELSLTEGQQIRQLLARFDYDCDSILNAAEASTFARGTQKSEEHTAQIKQLAQGRGITVEMLRAWYSKGEPALTCDIGRDWHDATALDPVATPPPNHPTALVSWVGADSASVGADVCESLATALAAAAFTGAVEFGKQGVALPLYIATASIVASAICTHKLFFVGDDVLLPETQQPEAGAEPEADGSEPRADGTDAGSQGPAVVPDADPEVADAGDGDGLVPWRKRVMPYRFAAVLAAAVAWGVCALICPFVLWNPAEDLDAVSAPANELRPGTRAWASICVGCGAGLLCALSSVLAGMSSSREAVLRVAGRGVSEVVSRGLATAMMTSIAPAVVVTAAVLYSHYLSGPYGVALAAFGTMLPHGSVVALSTCGLSALQMNAVAEMASCPEWVRDRCAVLRSLGTELNRNYNALSDCTAALSAAAALSAFGQSADITSFELNEMETLCGLLLGAAAVLSTGASATLGADTAARAAVAEGRKLWMGRLGSKQTATPVSFEDVSHTGAIECCVVSACEEATKHALTQVCAGTFLPLALGLLFGARCVGGLILGSAAVGLVMCALWSGAGAVWRGARRWMDRGRLTDAVPEMRRFDGSTVTDPAEAAWGGPLGGLGGSDGREVMHKGTSYYAAVMSGELVGLPLRDAARPGATSIMKLSANMALATAPLYTTDWSYWWAGLCTLAVGAGITLAARKLVSRKEDW